MPVAASHGKPPATSFYAPTCNTIIFDLGDVLFTWSAITRTDISPRTLRKILDLPSWFEYEKGNITESESYAVAADALSLEAGSVRDAFQGARDSLTSRSSMIDLIRELKPGRRIYAMSNISAEDYKVLATKSPDWDIFDRVFTSSAARERKPNLGFYLHVLKETGADPARTIFVDDKHENVLTARSFGMTGVIYDNFDNVQRKLRNLCSNPLDRAQDFLRKHAKKHFSFTSAGSPIQDNFAQLLIYEATGDPSLVCVEFSRTGGHFNFFLNGGESTTKKFPCDIDTTSIGLTVSDTVDDKTKANVMSEMISLCNSDNLLPVYFDAARPRIDPVVCVNALTLFYTNGRGAELGTTLEWVESVLVNRAYVDGTRYYVTAESFLFFLSRLLAVSQFVRERIGGVYAQRCRERLGVPGDALALAMRIISCRSAGIDCSRDVEALLDMQQSDGGWNDGWFCKYGSSDLLIANRGLTTASAKKALEGEIIG